MKFILSTLACVLALASVSQAVEALLTDDTIVSTTPALARSNFGAASTLGVTPSLKTLLRFSLETLPSNISPDAVTKATLRLWISNVSKAGDVQVAPVVAGPHADWQELTVTGAAAPAIGADLATVSLTRLSARQFAAIDVTALVKQWLGTPSGNLGIELHSSTAMASFDSKENGLTGHLPVLEISIAETVSAPTWSDIGAKPTTLAGFGITDAVSSVGATTYGSSLLTLPDVYAQRYALSVPEPREGLGWINQKLTRSPGPGVYPISVGMFGDSVMQGKAGELSVALRQSLGFAGFGVGMVIGVGSGGASYVRDDFTIWVNGAYWSSGARVDRVAGGRRAQCGGRYPEDLLRAGARSRNLCDSNECRRRRLRR